MDRWVEAGYQRSSHPVEEGARQVATAISEPACGKRSRAIPPGHDGEGLDSFYMEANKTRHREELPHPH